MGSEIIRVYPIIQSLHLAGFGFVDHEQAYFACVSSMDSFQAE